MRSTRTLAAALLGAATLASPAFAMPPDPPQRPARSPLVQTAAPSDDASSGFDWSSAGIGAAGGVGAFAIALAGIAGTRRRRLPARTRRHPLATAHSPAAPRRDLSRQTRSRSPMSALADTKEPAMTRHHLILRTLIPTIAAATLAASAASAMPARDTGWRAAGYELRTHHTVLLPGRVDAAAHAATIRGIGALLAERTGQ